MCHYEGTIKIIETSTCLEHVLMNKLNNILFYNIILHFLVFRIRVSGPDTIKYNLSKYNDVLYNETKKKT